MMTSSSSFAEDTSELISRNPCTQDIIWQGKATTPQEIDALVANARKAFQAWRLTDFATRQKIIEEFGQLLADRHEEFATLIARETGKPLWDAKSEVGAMVNKIPISITAYHERTGSKRQENAGICQELSHRPHGIAAVFGPYNFPGHLPNGHIVPALLAGNVVIFKPSELTPATGAEMVALWQEAGLPDGVLQIVQGGQQSGAALANHPDIHALFFTGSVATGTMLHRQWAGQLHKIMALELGGNAPLIVWDCKDIAAACYHIAFSAFVSAGQRCTCARRLIIPQGQAGDALLDQLCAYLKQIKIGPWDDDPQPFYGPVISNESADRLLQAWQNLKSLGGVALLEMQRMAPDLPYLTPGLIDMSAVANPPDEEYFGPLLQIYRKADFASALAQANATRFGLAAGILTDEQELYQKFSQEIRAGIVNWNRPTTGASSAYPFGGVGESGNHRPSAYYAADYCAYPVAGNLAANLEIPAQLQPGLPK